MSTKLVEGVGLTRVAVLAADVRSEVERVAEVLEVGVADAAVRDELLVIRLVAADARALADSGRGYECECEEKAR